MVTRLELFSQEMEKPKELYTAEIKKFAERYSCLGKLTVTEEPDIDTMDYVFSFEKIGHTTEEEWNKILLEIYDHMEEFSKSEELEKFNQNAIILL